MQVEVTNRSQSPITACFRTYPPRSTQVIECGAKQYHITADAGLRVRALDGDPGRPIWGRKPLRWIVSGGTWQQLYADAVVSEKLAGDTVFAQNATADRGPFPEGINCVPLTFRDHYQLIVDDFNAGLYPPGHTVVYVMENSSGNDTPVTEIENLEQYAKQIKDMLAGSGVTFIHSISLTAATYLDDQSRGDMEAGYAFIDERCAYRGALHADVFQGQTQRLVFDLPKFRDMAMAVGAQGNARARRIPILAGMTTTKSHQTTEAAKVEDMLAAAYSALPFVDGFWMNVPKHHETGDRDFELMLDFMRKFER